MPYARTNPEPVPRKPRRKHEAGVTDIGIDYRDAIGVAVDISRPLRLQEHAPQRGQKGARTVQRQIDGVLLGRGSRMRARSIGVSRSNGHVLRVSNPARHACGPPVRSTRHRLANIGRK